MYSLESFQNEIEALTGVPAHDQIILTSQGEQLSQALLLKCKQETDSVVFVFDRQLFTGGSSGEALVEVPTLEDVEHQGKYRKWYSI
jgi:hypothetical protein